MKTGTTDDGSVDEVFLRLWLSDTQLLCTEFNEVIAA